MVVAPPMQDVSVLELPGAPLVEHSPEEAPSAPLPAKPEESLGGMFSEVTFPEVQPEPVDPELEKGASAAETSFEELGGPAMVEPEKAPEPGPPPPRPEP
jgi:hypothetical protein